MDAIGIAEDVLLISVAALTVVTDWRWQRIPNLVTYPAMLVGLILGALQGIPGQLLSHGLIDHLGGAGLALAVVWPFYRAGGLKAGDGKLLMAFGALKGTTFLMVAALYGALAGGVLALVLIAARRLTPPEDDEPNALRRLMRSRIPYGVALGVGAVIALILERSRGL